MKVEVSFGLFSSPTEPFGSVAGTLSLAQIPSVGDMVKIPIPIDDSEQKYELPLRVTRVRLTPDSGQPSVIVEDYVGTSRAEIASIAEYLENKLGFYVANFDDIERDGNPFA